MAILNGPNLDQMVHGDAGDEHYDELMKLLRALDGLVQCRVIDSAISVPPASPSDGDMYLIPPGASGAWTGAAKNLARWSSVEGVWEFYVPLAGWRCHVAATSQNLTYTDPNWEYTEGGTEYFADELSLELDVGTFRVKDLGITTAKIADDAVTEPKIADSAVTTDKLATDAVTEVKITNNVVTNAKLATMPTARFKGRVNSGTGNVEDLTATEARQILGEKVISLTYASTVTVDASVANNFRLELAGNCTLANPSNLINGQVLNFRIKQTTGSHTVTFGSMYKFPGGIAPPLSTAAGALDFMSCQYDSADSNMVCVITKNLS